MLRNAVVLVRVPTALPLGAGTAAVPAAIADQGWSVAAARLDDQGWS